MSQKGAILPGGGYPSSPPTSPVKIAGQVVLGLSQSSRLRTRILVTAALGFLSVCLLFYSGPKLPYGGYISSPFNGYNPFSDVSTTRWVDDAETEPLLSNSSEDSRKRSEFHLLIPAAKSSSKLCRTILSAALLDYPPPTLLNYGSSGEANDSEAFQTLQATSKFLSGPKVQNGDLVIIVEEETWLQLPADVMVHRFVRHMDEADQRLLQVYGIARTGNETEKSLYSTPQSSPHQRYTERVVFGAEKVCTGHDNNRLACFASPASTLDEDIYGPQTGKTIETTRPRFLAAHNAIGRVVDLRPVYEMAVHRIELERAEIYSATLMIAQLFGEQEFQREHTYRTNLEMKASSWSKWWSGKFGNGAYAGLGNDTHNITAQSHELGIGLDYGSLIFQTINNSVEDLQFLTFNHPVSVQTPSKKAAKSFAVPLKVPSDLNQTEDPFVQHHDPKQGLDRNDEPQDNIDSMPLGNKWTDVSLATNVIVPGSSVPAALHFPEDDELIRDWWPKMWYQPYARALLRRYMRSPQAITQAENADGGGEKWWDLRGGKGGVWTDEGEWLEWNEVCGAFSEEVFRDGKGTFGKEIEEENKPLYNSFGMLVAGVEDEAAKNAAKEKAKLEEAKKEEEKKEEKKKEEEKKKDKERKEEESSKAARKEEEKKKQEADEEKSEKERNLEEDTKQNRIEMDEEIDRVTV